MVTGFIEKILRKIKNTSDSNDSQDVAEIVQLVSVSLYFDKLVTKDELNKAQQIVSILFDSDANYVFNQIKENLEKYKEEFWLFQKDKDEVLRKILVENKWIYAEYMIEIFKSDGISASENEYVHRLKKLVDERKSLLKDLGIKVD
jgi:uncharacterized tellurite resistance protein B-like protein